MVRKITLIQSGSNGVQGTDRPGFTVLAKYELKRHQRCIGVVTDPGLYPPHLNINPGPPPAWHPWGHLPPIHALKPTHRLGRNMPCSSVPYERLRLPRQRCSDFNTLHTDYATCCD